MDEVRKALTKQFGKKKAKAAELKLGWRARPVTITRWKAFPGGAFPLRWSA